MTYKEIKENYYKYYESPGFERTGLFECIKNTFGMKQVVYLGSSIHITPSFIFQNVTYIDNSDRAKCFFSNVHTISEFVKSKRKYKQNPSIYFLPVNYNKALNSVRYKFDIVISIYAPYSFHRLKDYVNNNGIIIYLPLPSDNSHVKDAMNFKYIGYICRKKETYVYYKEKTPCPVRNTPPVSYFKGDLFQENNYYQVYINRSLFPHLTSID